MFTGIIEELGRVAALDTGAAGARLTIGATTVLNDAIVGASIAVNGTCLTAVELTPTQFSADLAPETLARTNLAGLRAGSPVNLERPLRATGRLDGHFVLGHVDATAELVSIEALGSGHWWMQIRLPAEVTRYVVEKGSIAVDGISLTVAKIESSVASFTIIPHTYETTTLHSYAPGARVNVEIDMLAKHLEKLIGSTIPVVATQ
jgi:riboflavin synthase